MVKAKLKAKATKSSKKPKKKASTKPGPAGVKGSVTKALEAKKGTTFTEAGVTRGMSEDLQDAWQKLRAFAVDLGPQRIYASALAIMFAKKICYFYARPKKNYIEVWIFLPRKIEGLPAMQAATQKVKFCSMFKLIHADQVEEPLTEWLREAYEYAPE